MERTQEKTKNKPNKIYSAAFYEKTKRIKSTTTLTIVFVSSDGCADDGHPLLLNYDHVSSHTSCAGRIILHLGPIVPRVELIKELLYDEVTQTQKKKK